MSDLTTIALLEKILKEEPGSLEGDTYSELMIRHASEVVRDAAERPEWALEAPEGSGLVVAPQRAQDIALWVAKRAWGDTGNLQSKTSGPIKEVYFPHGIAALELTASERKWLEGQSAGGANTGLWVQPVGGGRITGAIYVPDGTPGADPVLMDDGSAGFAYGVFS